LTDERRKSEIRKSKSETNPEFNDFAIHALWIFGFSNDWKFWSIAFPSFGSFDVFVI